jgi:hypothetical protein
MRQKTIFAQAARFQASAQLCYALMNQTVGDTSWLEEYRKKLLRASGEENAMIRLPTCPDFYIQF